MPTLDLAPLLAAVQARSSGIGSRLHGERHWQAVARIGGDLVRAVPGADPLVVFLFGLLHDAMRENDGYDPGHGPRAAVLARELAATGLIPLDRHQLDLLETACEFHADGETSADPTIGACWDADRLTLGRVGITPSAALLSTAPARRAEWILGAPAVAATRPGWEVLLAASGEAPVPGSLWLEPGSVLAGSYAGSRRPETARARVARLLAAGVTAFVDLTEDGELAPYASLLADGVAHRRFPIPDLSCTSAAHLGRILDAIDGEIAAGRTVYLHCRAGCGRTGTVAASWLVRHGVAPEVALARFASLRQAVGEGRCPETEEQRLLVLGWSQRSA